eukprot:254820_1
MAELPVEDRTTGIPQITGDQNAYSFNDKSLEGPTPAIEIKNTKTRKVSHSYVMRSSFSMARRARSATVFKWKNEAGEDQDINDINKELKETYYNYPLFGKKAAASDYDAIFLVHGAKEEPIAPRAPKAPLIFRNDDDTLVFEFDNKRAYGKRQTITLEPGATQIQLHNSKGYTYVYIMKDDGQWDMKRTGKGA